MASRPDHRLSALTGMRTRIVVWFFVPAAIILVSIALVNFYAYQDVTQELVMERDRQLTRLAAGQLSAELSQFTDLLLEIARTTDMISGTTLDREAALRRASSRLVVFDGGVVVLDHYGTVVTTQPYRRELIGSDWSDRSYFLQMVRTLAPVFSNVVSAEGTDPGEVIVLTVPILGEQKAFIGSISGILHLNSPSVSGLYSMIVGLRMIESGTTYLVDGEGRAIYHSDLALVGTDMSKQDVVLQALAGQTSTIRTKDTDGKEIIAGFAPVPKTPWVLVKSERWDSVTSGSREYQRFLLLLLALGIAVPSMFVVIGMRRFMRPIDDLVKAVREVAKGNFGHAVDIHTGDEIEDLAGEFNLMASQLQESYQDLEHKVAERTEEVRRAEGKYRSIFENAVEGMYQSTPAGKIVIANPSLARILGYDSPEDLFASIEDLEQQIFVDPVRRQEELLDLEANGAILGFEFEAYREDGSKIWVSDSARAVRGEDGEIVYYEGTLEDITERKRAEEQVKEMAVLAERNRMAREIHDTLAQGFTGIILQMEAAEQALDGSPSELPDHLRRAKDLARESLQEARRSVWDLRPQSLERGSLELALQEEARRFAASAQKQAHFSLSGDRCELPPNVQAALLRICQESLANVKRHSMATEVSVHLNFYSTAVCLEIQDNGIGFKVAELESDDRQSGFGLAAMEQRTSLLSGTLEVLSQEEKGTLIRATIPFQT